MILLSYLYNIDSDRQLCEEVGFNLAYRWFCRLSLKDSVPDHSSLTRIRDRLGEPSPQPVDRRPPTPLEQVVGVILGSPEFQRR